LLAEEGVAMPCLVRFGGRVLGVAAAAAAAAVAAADAAALPLPLLLLLCNSVLMQAPLPATLAWTR
jgi:hypothetical protein